ncbi:putative holin-like toxin [Clostridium sp. D5]|nr:putative holin-like toxin [Clostridium sp. D5]
MDTYQVLSLMFLGGGFLIALLTYIDRHNKRK